MLLLLLLLLLSFLGKGGGGFLGVCYCAGDSSIYSRNLC
jgi:hypothetical protein